MALTWAHSLPHTQSGVNSKADITTRLLLKVQNIKIHLLSEIQFKVKFIVVLLHFLFIHYSDSLGETLTSLVIVVLLKLSLRCGLGWVVMAISSSYITSVNNTCVHLTCLGPVYTDVIKDILYCNFHCCLVVSEVRILDKQTNFFCVYFSIPVWLPCYSAEEFCIKLF